MKTLKWLWLTSLAIILFQVFNAVIGAANGTHNFDAESLVGMVLLFALISVALVFFWIFRSAKEKITGKKTS